MKVNIIIKSNLNLALPVQIFPTKGKRNIKGKTAGCPFKVKGGD
jgi:hypothetical protein